MSGSEILFLLVVLTGAFIAYRRFGFSFGKKLIRVVEIGQANPKLAPGLVAYAAAGGRMLVRVKGTPFGAPQEKFAEWTAESITGHYAGRHIRFTASEEPGMRSEYCLLLTFSDLPNGEGDDPCQHQDPLRGPLEDKAGLYLHATFCHHGQGLKTVCGHLPSLPYGHEAKLKSLIKYTVRDLMPGMKQE